MAAMRDSEIAKALAPLRRLPAPVLTAFTDAAFHGRLIDVAHGSYVASTGLVSLVARAGLARDLGQLALEHGLSVHSESAGEMAVFDASAPAGPRLRARLVCTKVPTRDVLPLVACHLEQADASVRETGFVFEPVRALRTASQPRFRSLPELVASLADAASDVSNDPRSLDAVELAHELASRLFAELESAPFGTIPPGSGAGTFATLLGDALDQDADLPLTYLSCAADLEPVLTWSLSRAHLIDVARALDTPAPPAAAAAARPRVPRPRSGQGRASAAVPR